MELFLLVVIILIITTLIKAISYWNSSYYDVTRNSFLGTSFNAGASGEYQLYKTLKSYEAAGARFLFNCYLPASNGKTSEIDVIMIYRSGIYVFESKNYGGWIFGSESNQMWTQTLRSRLGVQKERFYNPIKQNRTHIKWIERQIGSMYPIHNIVVFSNRCEFMDLTITSDDVHVIHVKDVFNTVHEIDTAHGFRLEQHQVDQIYNVLFPYAKTATGIKEAHVENTRKMHDSTGDVSGLRQKTCPRCGGALVVRTAKRGYYAGNRFYGCSNYPACRYTQNIES